MDKSLLVIVIPAANIRELFSPALQDFGLSSEKDIAAFYPFKIECPPISPNPDFIVIRQIELKRPHRAKLTQIFSHYDLLYVAHHEGSDFEENFPIDFDGIQNQICFESFHREPTDSLYQKILTLFRCASKKNKSEAFQQAQNDLMNSFRVDLEMEAELAGQHKKIHCPTQIEMSKDTLILWNDNEFSKKLGKALEPSNIAVSEEDFKQKLNGKKKLLILAELNWNNKNLSHFYGYELANGLIAQNYEFDIAFVSCIDRETLKGINAFSRLLVPLFPHFKLPFPANNELKIVIPPISSTKWSTIRNYYLKPDGIVDKLLHDMKKLTKFTDKGKTIKVLKNIQSYSQILDCPIIEQAKRIEILIEQNAGYLGLEILKLQGLLDEFYLKWLETDKMEPEAPKYSSQVMVVEDDPATLKVLSNGLSNYFTEVVDFTLGSDALSNLNKQSRSYSALIIDMELLDEDGNWQEIQGSDLIEKASHYPHLVIYMFTAYSKRALANIKGKINLGEVNYISKDAINGLPPEMSYKKFAKELMKKIKKRQKFHDGPKLGSWNKGLLHFYYQILQTDEGQNLWFEVTEAVDRFIENEEKKDENIIPSKLFHVDTREFDLDKLKTVLIHRLINLYYQYKEEGPVNFQSHIRKVLGLQIKNAKQYYNSLLGLSAILENSEEKNSVYRIQMKGLFPEEIEWLKTRNKDAHSLKFPKLYQAIEDAKEYLPLQVKHNNHRLLSSIETLDDCLKVIKLFTKLSGKSRFDVGVDLIDYKNNYPKEFSQLKRDPVGRKIAELIEAFDLE